MGPEQRKLKLFSACNRLTVGESKKAEEILHCSQFIYIHIYLHVAYSGVKIPRENSRDPYATC